ncbi:hypothetical protein HGRIS_011396 [Hohenbuehelia grisea]|uniref:CST complex subunit STN1 n=1 Tax=Hohenbuehelia grisea TaxID=104357 RepID=A0ABR3JV28_9AGAR
MSSIASPPKRRRIESLKSSGDSMARTPSVQCPSIDSAEIWKWTLTKEAIAPCFLRDVLEMKDGSGKDPDFFWLGRIPCRTVRLVGLIVGVSVWEKRTVYMLDDGTAVVDCIYRTASSDNPEPTVKLQGSSGSKDNSVSSTVRPHSSPKKGGFNPSWRTGGQMSFSRSADRRFRVGVCVRIVGRVAKWRDSKQIHINEIDLCTSPNEEPIHWRTVRGLHRTRYAIDAEGGGPFIIPKLSPPSTDVANGLVNDETQGALITPRKDRSKAAGSDIPDWCPSSASSSSATDSDALNSSPIRVHPGGSTSTSRRAPDFVRLRHPARLRSHDLTANTFKIYVKYYMDHAPDLKDLSEDSDDEGTESGRCTPTPSSRQRQQSRGELTPRPAPRRDNSLRDHTHIINNTTSTIPGFTLSYLRRVPALGYMALRVVEAEARRRAREEKKGAKDTTEGKARSQSVRHPTREKENTGSQAKHPASYAGAQSATARESPHPKMKRLFIHAIRKLYDEGSIVISDGPARSCASLERAYSQNLTNIDDSSLWKLSSTAANCANTSIMSSVSMLSHRNVLDIDESLFSVKGGDNSSRLDAYRAYVQHADDDDAALSDPREDEESYVPLSPAYLGPMVERVITQLMERAKKSSAPARAKQSASAPASQAGPNAVEITACLKRQDGRWARVGEWAVNEALELLEAEGRVWVVRGEGSDRRWERCL